MGHEASLTTGGNVFIVTPASAHAWLVGYARRLIPGAVLYTREAALEYVAALAQAAGYKAAVRIARPRNFAHRRVRARA